MDDYHAYEQKHATSIKPQDGPTLNFSYKKINTNTQQHKLSTWTISTMPTICPMNTTQTCLGDDDYPHTEHTQTPPSMPANQPVSLPQFNKPEQTRLTKIERDTYSDRPYCFSKDVTEQQYETHLDSITKEMLCLEELKIKPQRINPFDMVTIGTPKQSLKKLLLIDLDETLIHSYRQTTSFATPLLINHQGANYIYWISMRPFAKEFLQALKEHWIIYIFTASAEDYAKKIVKMLDPDGQCVTGVLSRNHCFSEKGIIIKDLRIIRNIPLKDIAILDNSVRSFLFQPDNGIPIIGWYDDPTDKELMAMKDFLISLAKSEDVRKPIKQRFDLNNFLYNC